MAKMAEGAAYSYIAHIKEYPSQSPSCIVQFQKISILPPEKGLEFPGGGGFCKAKKFKEMYEA